MQLDHISYVTSHDLLLDTVQRLGSRMSTTFIDGGIHPRFGTRNFTAPLLGGQYLEVVCPLDHPATENTPWGKAVVEKSLKGGGWLTWVFSTNDIKSIAQKFGRESVEGHRTRPDGYDLKWKQIGVKEINNSKELPFFIQWLTREHPSMNGKAESKIKKIIICDETQLAGSWFKDEILYSLDGIEIEWQLPSEENPERGLVAIEFSTPRGNLLVD